ncbi:unnamed protein product, partial [Citrullus colocynthis]
HLLRSSLWTHPKFQPSPSFGCFELQNSNLLSFIRLHCASKFKSSLFNCVALRFDISKYCAPIQAIRE